MDFAFGFEVHQPFRVRKDYYWKASIFRERNKVFDYFDNELNQRIFRRIKNNCYNPTLDLLQELWEKYDFKTFVSISGTFVEQAIAWGKEVIDKISRLVSKGAIELLCQTYYHSITSLWDDLSEWRDQVKEHVDLMRETFGFSPKLFENTELIYSRRIIDEIRRFNFSGIIMEGAETLLKGKDPNFSYNYEGLKVIFRNYKLSDDIAFRFSNADWSEYPLTAEKYAKWVSSSSGDHILVFIDFETFGEHHKAESGIFSFLRALPKKLKEEGVNFIHPSETKSPIGDIYLDERYYSWADAKDERSWRGNQMQWATDEQLRKLEGLVKRIGGDYLKAWKYFTTSDHVYYMFRGFGSSQQVHSYFSHYSSPEDAFINVFSSLLDLEYRTREILGIKHSPYRLKGEGSRYLWTKEEVSGLNEEGLSEWLREEF